MSLPTYLVAVSAGVQFMVLNSMVAPLPFKVRKAYLRFLMTSKSVARFVYFLKIVHIFIAVLFVDAFRTAYIVTLSPESERFNSSLDGGDPAMTASTGTAARKLLAERNMNLTAMSLFTFYLIWRVYELNMENVRWGEVALSQQGQDTGPPIEEHREDFRRNYEGAKPDHQKDIKNRGLNKDGSSTTDSKAQ